MSEDVAADIAPPLNVTEAAREMANGVTSAFVLLALMLPLGLLAFGWVTFSEADGYSGVKAGVRAEFAAAVFENLSALVLGSPLLPNEVPRASTVFVFAGFIAHLAKVGVEAMDIVLLAGACLALSGAIQVAFGLLRLGNIARFVPYPVVAGLMTGLAFYNPDWTFKLILIAGFVLMTNPISSHALSRAAHFIRTACMTRSTCCSTVWSAAGAGYGWRVSPTGRCGSKPQVVGCESHRPESGWRP